MLCQYKNMTQSNIIHEVLMIMQYLYIGTCNGITSVSISHVNKILQMLLTPLSRMLFVITCFGSIK